MHPTSGLPLAHARYQRRHLTALTAQERLRKPTHASTASEREREQRNSNPEHATAQRGASVTVGTQTLSLSCRCSGSWTWSSRRSRVKGFSALSFSTRSLQLNATSICSPPPHARSRQPCARPFTP
eukprot:2656659-Rhodomonas_salina.4